MIGSFKPPSILQVNPGIILDKKFIEKEIQEIGDNILKTVQDLNTNTLKKITFPISPFKKKYRTKSSSTVDKNLVRMKSIENHNGLKVVSVHDKLFFRDIFVNNGTNRTESAEDYRKTREDFSRNSLTYMNSEEALRVPDAHDRCSKASLHVENNFPTVLDDNDEEERTLYMNHLDLDRARRSGLQILNYDRKGITAGNHVITNEMLVHDHEASQNTILNSSQEAYNSLGTKCFVNKDLLGDKEKDLKCNTLNLTITDKKKQLVDRIKKSIIKNSKPFAKENIDLSIVKDELPETEPSVSNEEEKSDTEDLSPAPIEQVNIKMEPASNLVFEDNLVNGIGMPTNGHFMALPVLRQNTKQNTELSDSQGTTPNIDCVVLHKVVCLICKKTETVPMKKSCVQGNIFLCKTCSNLFNKRGDSHELPADTSEYSIRDVTCIRCNLTFSNALEVETHRLEMHSDELQTETGGAKSKRHIKPQYCNDCKKTFDDPDEVCKHIKSRRHKCEYCHKLFSTNSDLKKHVNIHTNEKTYVCIYCSKAFNSRGNMVKHLETHRERKRSFKCEFCNKTFLKSDHLKVHVNTHTNEKLYECPYCKKTFNRKYCLQLHINIHTLEKIYECHFCNKICMDPSTLRKHIGTHSDQRPFKCELCDKTFKQKPHLTAHMKMHDIKQTFSCSYCDKIFFSKNTLRVHINTHTHEKTFLCVYCQKSFTSKSNLLTHVNNKHTIDRTYNCSYCGKVFTDPSTVKKHENIHTNELTYQCAYCDKVFLRKTHLRSHINMHIKYKPYKCKLCDKSFAIKGYLKVHYNIHKGIKPFKCKRCGKAFTSKSNLILHTNSHTKEQMFQCSYCRKDFTQKANLKSHIIRSHMEIENSPSEK